MGLKRDFFFLLGFISRFFFIIWEEFGGWGLYCFFLESFRFYFCGSFYLGRVRLDYIGRESWGKDVGVAGGVFCFVGFFFFDRELVEFRKGDFVWKWCSKRMRAMILGVFRYSYIFYFEWRGARMILSESVKNEIR